MESVFLKLLNMSIAASWLILAVLLLRFLLKKAPKYFSCILWALVGIRLVWPFSLESVLSLIPSAETVPEHSLYSSAPSIDSGIGVINNTLNPIISEAFAPQVVGGSVNPLQIFVYGASVLWLIGLIGMVIYAGISYARIRRRVRESIQWDGEIRLCDRIDTPFILGLFRPRIYLPSSMDEADMEFVIAHEKAHLKRRDHWWKPLGFAILSVYWFNPLIWVAYILLCKDIELACDEKVLKELGMAIKKPYSEALVHCSVSRRTIAACPLAFGENNISGRIRSVLHYKKPTFWLILLALLACIVAAVCFLTDPPVGHIETASYTGIEGLELSISALETDTVSPYIEVRFRDRTDHEITYGEPFRILKKTDGEWRDCSVLDTVFNLPAYSSMSGVFEKKYSLAYQNMTEPGIYRFETVIHVDRAEQTVWAEFELKSGIPLVTVRDFETVSLHGFPCPTWNSSRFLMAKNFGSDAVFRMVNAANGITLLEGENGTLGHMQEITLTEDNFESRFYDQPGGWYSKMNAETLRTENQRAWELKVKNEYFHDLYLLLEQKNGAFYLLVGYYGGEGQNETNSDGSLFTHLYQLAERDASSSEPIEEIKGTSCMKIAVEDYLEAVPNEEIRRWIEDQTDTGKTKALRHEAEDGMTRYLVCLPAYDTDAEVTAEPFGNAVQLEVEEGSRKGETLLILVSSDEASKLHLYCNTYRVELDITEVDYPIGLSDGGAVNE